MNGYKIQSTATIRLSATLLALAALFAVTLPLSPQQPGGDDAIVKQFYPASLAAEAKADFSAGGPPPFQASAFAPADLNGSGTNDFLVAAYTNGFSAVVRVLKKQGASAVLVSEPQVPLMGGIYPTVSLVDLDNDGRPEVVVGLSSARGAVADWIFKWNGSGLQLMGPTNAGSDGSPTTLLGDADFVDLNGDGILEIVNPPDFNSVSPGSGAPITFTVFTLSNGKYVPSNTVFNFFRTYVRGPAAPAAATETFTVSDPGVAYAITIANGDGRGGKRVSSATITLNGRVVAGPDAFNQKAATLTIPVTVLSSNTITVQMAGAPGAQLSIGIGPK